LYIFTANKNFLSKSRSSSKQQQAAATTSKNNKAATRVTITTLVGNPPGQSC